ncbi:MAG: MBG domain-containing protein, partial [Pseudomonadota bacterium]
GNFTFEGDSSSAIVNQGNIRTADEGYVALIAAEIINEGSIKAPKGDVLMGAGSRVTLDMGGPIKIEVEQARLDTYIEQGGAIKADGGRVYLTAKAAGDLAASVINHTGVTQAQTLAENEQGEIWLMGDMDSGETRVAGTLDASAPEGGDGGFIETSAAKVTIKDEATVTTRADDGKTGEWLIDPYDFSIAESGGDLTGAALSSALGNNDVTIETTASNVSCTGVTGCGGGDGGGKGDIFVNDNVTWDTNTLTLSAYRNIEINREMTATSGGGLALAHGQGATDGIIDGTETTYAVNAPVNLPADGSFSTKLGSNGATVDYTIITELGDAGSGTGTNLQGIRGGLSGNYVLGANIDASDTSGWNSSDGFEPIGDNDNNFEGTFDGLGHTISDLTMDRPRSYYQGLFGYISGAAIRNVGLEGGSVEGDFYVGGLVGFSGLNSTVSNSYVTGDVTGYGNVGGLVGNNQGSSLISNSYSAANVEGGGSDVGGLVGFNRESTVRNSYATGSVTGGQSTGGLMGYNRDAEVRNTYATGLVNEGNADTYVGGLVGLNENGGVHDSFWDTETTGQNTSDGGTAKNTAQMRDAATYTNAGWSGDEWSFPQGGGSAVEGYEVGDGLPYLTGVTRNKDVNSERLFEGGWGGLSAGEQSGADGSAYIITDWNQLQNINQVVGDGYNFVLANSLDRNSAGYAEQIFSSEGFANGGGGWEPIGDNNTPFNGEFDGNKNTISGLDIARQDVSYQGLFGYISGAVIRNVGLEGGSVTGSLYVGGLVGYSASNSMVSNTYASVSVEGGNFLGGLVGGNYNSTVSKSYATGSVDSISGSSVGGLVGEGMGGSVINSFWDTETSWQETSAGGTGLSTVEMHNPFIFIDQGWDFADVWGKSRVGNNGRYMVFKASDDTAYDHYVRLGDTDTSKTYGTIDSDLDSIGLDGPGSDNIALQFNNALNAGTYRYDESGVLIFQFNRGSEQDYYLDYGNGKITIDPRALTVIADGDSKTYDGLAYSGGNGVSYQGFAAGEDENDLDGSINFTGDAQGATDAGSYAITPEGLSAHNYDIDYADGILTIDKAEATVTANSDTVTYNGIEQSVTGFTAEGLVNGETETVLDGVTTSGGSGIDADSYTHTASGTDNNYSLSFTDGALTIEKAEATVTANSDTVTYNGAAQSVTGFTVEGLVNGETQTVLGGVTTSGGSGIDADSYTHTASGTDNNYNLSFTDGVLTIEKAEATVTANSDTVTYDGTEQSVTGYAVSGLVNGEDESVLDNVTTMGGRGTDASSYVYEVDGSDNNYSLSFVDGTLTIDPRAITVAADNKQKTEGEPDPEFTWRLTEGNLAADDALKGGLMRTTGEQPGTYSILQGDLTQAQNPNYAINFLEGALTIAEESTVPETRARPNTDNVINNVLDAIASLRPQPTFSYSELPVQVAGTGIRITPQDEQD